MTNDEKIVKILEALQAGQEQIIGDVSSLKDSVTHLQTGVKTLPTKQDVEVIVESAKAELKADMLNLEAKVVKKIQSNDRRITNLEEATGTHNPEKN